MWEVCLVDPSSADAQWIEFEEKSNDSPAWAVAESYVREEPSQFRVAREEYIWVRPAGSPICTRFDVTIEMVPEVTLDNPKSIDCDSLNPRCPHTQDMFEQAASHV